MKSFQLLLAALLLAVPVWANVLIIEVSDAHATYDRIPLFIKAISRRRQEFLAKFPQGQVVLLVNGDWNSYSRWTFPPRPARARADHGRLLYEVLASLADDYEIVFNIGNHDEFDWGGGGPNLFYRWHDIVARKLQSQGKTHAIITANVVPAATARPNHRFAKYKDIPLKTGGKLRFVGLLLHEFFKGSSYSRDGREQLIDDVLPPNPVAHQQYRQAVADGVKVLVFAMHDNIREVGKVAAHVTRGIREGAAGPSLPIWFAGHVHRPSTTLEEKYTIVQAGNEFDFATAEIDDEGRLADTPEIWNEGRQRRIERTSEVVRLSKGENAAVDLARARMAHIAGSCFPYVTD